MAKNEKLTIEQIKQSLLDDINFGDDDQKKEPIKRQAPKKPVMAARREKENLSSDEEIKPANEAYIPPRPNIRRSGEKIITKQVTKRPEPQTTKEELKKESEIVETSMGAMDFDEFLAIMSMPEEEADKKIAEVKQNNKTTSSIQNSNTKSRDVENSRVEKVLENAKARLAKEQNAKREEKVTISQAKNSVSILDEKENKYLKNNDKNSENNSNNNYLINSELNENYSKNSVNNQKNNKNIEKTLINDENFGKNDDIFINNINQKENTEKDKNYKNSYIYGFIFIIGSILFEIVNFVRLGIGFLPTAFGIEIAILVILAGIIFIVPTEPLKITVMSIFFGVQIIMNVINASLYKVMYELVTTDMIFTLGMETADTIAWSYVDWLSIVCHLIVLAIVIGIMILANKLMPKFRVKKSKVAIVSLLVLIFSVEMIGFSGLKILENIYFANAEVTEYIDNNEYWYNNTTTAKFASLKKYGFWSYYFNNLGHFINYEETISENEVKTLAEYIANGENFTQTNSMYNSQNVSGSLAGDNLIMIMLESAEWFAIDPYNTPHLYDFIEDYSVKFSNYHARNKTNVSEQISMLGAVPYEYSLATISENVGISTPNSLPNLFKNQGYQSVNFFHDYYGDFYRRNTLNRQIGFSNVYAMEQSPIVDKSDYLGDFLDDGEFINSLKNEFMPKDKSFFSYFTTVTTHGPYEQTNSRYNDYYDRFERNYDDYCAWVKNNNLGYLTPVEGTNEYKILKEYKSKAMALDNMINVILNYLKTTRDGNNVPLYDNTTIVMFADHNCYYSDLGYIVKDVDKYANDTTIYNVPFAIFNKTLASGTINKFCSTYDIYPTVCDLYGLEYNNNLTQGYSVFSEDIDKTVYVSAMAGMFDDYYYTTTLDDFTEQDNTIETISRLADFKTKLNRFFYKQDNIEKYYRVNYEK